eukprot:scaffold5717_cov112-Isochrysis_galbana.AAC.7
MLLLRPRPWRRDMPTLRPTHAEEHRASQKPGHGAYGTTRVRQHQSDWQSMAHLMRDMPAGPNSNVPEEAE